MSPNDLLRKLNDAPFRPFRLKLSTNETIDVTDRGTVVVGESSAILPIRVRKTDDGFELVERWKTIALDHIVTFEDLEPADRGNGRNRGRK